MGDKVATPKADRSRGVRRIAAAVLLALLTAACQSASGSMTPGSTSPPRGAGVSSSPGTAGRPPVRSPVPSDWPTYHGDPARTGLAVDFPDGAGPLRKAWAATLDGAVYGQPLGVNGRVIAATENDTVYALDLATGRPIWQRHVGEPVALSTLPCGNIDPLGITSTPAYDPATNTIFVVAEVAGPRHVLYALDAPAGELLWSRNLDLPGDDPKYYQQRPALTVANGYVYVAFGGLDGDCGPYRGFVEGVPASGSGPGISYRVPVAREGGIWATGGAVVDPSGDLYVSVGNGGSTSGYDGSDSVVQLSPRLELKSRFAPSNWAEENAADADLGSMSPALVGDRWVFISGKGGKGFVLRRGALGGIGGEVSSQPLCRTFGAAAVTGATVYLPCTDGIARIEIDETGRIHNGWRTSTGANGPPVLGGGAVWSVATDSGTLYALSSDSGAELAHIDLGDVPHFASPTLWNGLVLVGTMRGVVAVRPGA